MKLDPAESLLSAPDVERSALGACFLDPMAFHELVSSGLRPEYFSIDTHRKIFRAIQQLVTDNVPVETMNVMHELERCRESRSISEADVSGLMDGVPEHLPAQQLHETLHHHVAILREKFYRRRVCEITERAVKCALDPSDDIRLTMSLLHDELLMAHGETSRAGHLVQEFSAEALALLKSRFHAGPGQLVGLTYGIHQVDDCTTGMRDWEVTVVGGFPGSGKSAFALDVSRKNAAQGTPVAIFSVEMTKLQILERLWSQHSDISYRKIRNPSDLSGSELRELEQKWVANVDKLPLLIDDDARALAEIVPRAHLYVRKHAVKLIVVDFLQIVDAPGEKEYDRVSNAIDALTMFAKRTGVPVMCLSQLSRPEDRKNAANVIPNMAMLRSTGKIEQNAHVILFTYHPRNDQGDPTGENLIIIEKQRGGMTKRIESRFNVRVQRWEERGAGAVNGIPSPL